jgi:hypothetical protein
VLDSPISENSDESSSEHSDDEEEKLEVEAPRPKKGMKKVANAIAESNGRRTMRPRPASYLQVVVSFDESESDEDTSEESDTASFGPTRRRTGKTNNNSNSNNSSAKKAAAVISVRNLRSQLPSLPPSSSRPTRHPMQPAEMPATVDTPQGKRKGSDNEVESDTSRRKSLRRASS